LQTYVPVDGSPDAAFSEALFRLFTHKKGDEFLSIFFSGCQIAHLPPSMLATLTRLREMASPPAAATGAPASPSAAPPSSVFD
jgi:putative ATP-dependent endonuclease of OLD family